MREVTLCEDFGGGGGGVLQPGNPQKMDPKTLSPEP